ncbi:hypothetical protein GWI33_017198 [Rhynchophorus ferrugineus]|uniref:Uncharacterized protein n=1 Tax=Rhynchophorus ferrugineus TaxID=354439 RepID=A0A834HVZ8_RHYFE|nr:hypothetical protein GWI33_017198 [Rhynchophorus ferrugineus]
MKIFFCTCTRESCGIQSLYKAKDICGQMGELLFKNVDKFLILKHEICVLNIVCKTLICDKARNNKWSKDLLLISMRTADAVRLAGINISKRPWRLLSA